MPVLLKEIPLLHGLSSEELTAIQGCLREKNFAKGEILSSEGSSCDKIFIVQSGRVKLYRMTSSGREQILEMLGPGDTCACNPGSREWSCFSTAEAVTPCKVWFLARDQYVQLVASNNHLSQALNRVFADRLRCFSTLIEEVSLKDTGKRIARFLLDMLAQKQVLPARSKNQVLFISFTREELAQRIGAARETVARKLHLLKRKKLIDIKPHQIIILNKEGLEKLLC